MLALVYRLMHFTSSGRSLLQFASFQHPGSIHSSKPDSQGEPCVARLAATMWLESVR